MSFLSWLTSDLTEEEKKKQGEVQRLEAAAVVPDFSSTGFTPEAQGATNVARAPEEPKYVNLRPKNVDATYIDPIESAKSGVGSLILGAADWMKDTAHTVVDWAGSGVKSPEELQQVKKDMDEYAKTHTPEETLRYAQQYEKDFKAKKKETHNLAKPMDDLETNYKVAQDELAGVNDVKNFETIWKDNKAVEAFKNMDEEQKKQVFKYMPIEQPTKNDPTTGFDSPEEEKVYNNWKAQEDARIAMIEANKGKKLTDEERAYQDIAEQVKMYTNDAKELETAVGSKALPAAIGNTAGMIAGELLKYATIAKVLGTTGAPQAASEFMTNLNGIKNAGNITRGVVSLGTRASIGGLANMAETQVSNLMAPEHAQSLEQSAPMDLAAGAAFPLAGDILNTSRMLRGGAKNWAKAAESGNTVIKENANAVNDVLKFQVNQRNSNAMKFLSENDKQVSNARNILTGLGLKPNEIDGALEKIMGAQDNSLLGLQSGADRFTQLAGDAKGQLVDRALPAPSFATRTEIALENSNKMPEVLNPQTIVPTTGNKDLLATEIGNSKSKLADLDQWMWKNKEAAMDINKINSDALSYQGKARATFIKNAKNEVRAKYVDQYLGETAGAAADLQKTTHIKALEAAGVDTSGLDKASNARVADIYETQLKQGKLKNVDMEAVKPSEGDLTNLANKTEAEGVRGFVDNMFEDAFNAGEVNTVDDLARLLSDETTADALAKSAALDPDGHQKFIQKLKDTAMGITKNNQDMDKVAMGAWKESPFYDLWSKDSRVKKLARELEQQKEPTQFGRTGTKSALDEIAQEFSDNYAIGDGYTQNFLDEFEKWYLGKPSRTAGTQKATAARLQNLNAFGLAGGIETDENGKVKFNAGNAAMGLVAGNIAPKVIDNIKGKNTGKAIDALFDATSKSLDAKVLSNAVDGNPLLRSLLGDLYKNDSIPKEVADQAKAAGMNINGAGVTTANDIATGVQKGFSKLGSDIERRLGEVFGGTAEYEKIKVKDQQIIADNLIANDLDMAKRMMNGEESLPEGLRGASLIDAMSRYIMETGDGVLAKELASSKIISESSVHAQELRMMAEIDPTDPLAAIKRVMKSRAESTSKYLKDVPLTDDEAQKVVDLSAIARERKTALDAVDSKDISEAAEAQRMEYGLAQVEMNNYIKTLQDPAFGTNMGEKEFWQKTDWKDKFLNQTWESNLVRDSLAFMKSMKASLDNSGIFRPGLKSLVVQPKAWANAVGQSWADMWHTMGGKRAGDALDAWIVSRPGYLDGTYKKAGLAVSVTEEAFPSSLPEKLPGWAGKAFEASEVAFTGLQKRLRINGFEKFLEEASKNAEKTGKPIMEDKEALKRLGGMANALTGRGNLGLAETWADGFNLLFFSPRNLAANVSTLKDIIHSPQLLKRAAGMEMSNVDFAKSIAAKNTLKITGSIAAVLGAASLINPDSVDWDPRSADFGKIKIGNTRVDMTAGMGSIAVLLARTVMPSQDAEGNWGIGRVKSSTTGLVTTLNDDTYGAQTVGDTVNKFLENKLSPGAAIAKNFWWSGKNFEGDKPTLLPSGEGESWKSGELLNSIMPFPIDNAMKAGKDKNAAPYWVTALTDATGLATTTYGNAKDIEPGSVYNLLDKTDKMEESQTVINKMKERGATDEQILALFDQYYKDEIAKERKGDPEKGIKPNRGYRPDAEAKIKRKKMLLELLN